MASLAGEVSFVGRHVIDRMAVTGAFDVDLEWTPESPGAALSPHAGASIFTALQELGPRARTVHCASGDHRHRQR
ncbi:MAG TPA: DUF3738 domain-containing protein [Vicinamibacterales bacterium]|nr:DUF3738 domain-containing protein [Vicinamibacterales bacterium]